MNMKSANGMVYFETTDGEQKVMKLDFNAIADLEALLGMGIGSLVNDENVGFNIIRGFYWAGLKFRDRGLTVEQAGNFIQSEIAGGKSFEDLMVPVTEALIASGIIDRADVEDAEEGMDFDDAEASEEDPKN